MNINVRSALRRIALTLIVIAGFALGPSAFARDHHSHTSFGISIGGPGYGVSYSDCRHCGGGWWNGYVNSGWGYPRYGGHHYSGGYGGGYYSGYPSPYYGGGYYPSYSTVIYDRPVQHRVYRVRHVDRYADDDDDDYRTSHRDRYNDDNDDDYEHLDRDYYR